MIHDIIIDNKLDILCITETWLGEHDAAAIAAMTPDTHTFFNGPRPNGRRGGGVALVAIKSLISAKASSSEHDFFENIELKFALNNLVYKIFVIYRPPGADSSLFCEEFSSFLFDKKQTNTRNIYVGDYNIWVNYESDPKTDEFLGLLEIFDLKNFVSEPTHESGNTLDLVISNSDCTYLKEVEVEPFNTISDHNAVFFKIIGNKVEKPKKKIHRRDKNLLNPLEFSNFLKNDLVNEIGETCDHDSVNQCVNCYAEKYNYHVENFINNRAPLIEKEINIINRNNRWYNEDTRRAKRELRRAEKKICRQRSEVNIQEYKRLRQSKCKLIHDQKATYCQKQIKECSTDMKKLSRILNSLLGKNLEERKLPVHDDHRKRACKFKNFFVEKVETINRSFPNVQTTNISYIPDFPTKKIRRINPVDDMEVLEILKNMNKTYCPEDPLDIKLFDTDTFLEDLVPFYTDVINKSFQSGIFPKCCKTAIVRPLIKSKKDPDDIASYRPVHNLTMLSKTIEIACLKQLKTFISKFELLPKTQSAYRRDHSVETVICRIYNDMISNKSRGINSILIMLDQSAAFDTVVQSILIDDLKTLGFDDIALQWFISYLTIRSFRVQVENEFSDKAAMHTGIPQGSVLAPILYSIYTAGLYNVLEGHNVKSYYYADDTQILIEMHNHNETTTKLEHIFRDPQVWMSCRKLKLSVDKTESILIQAGRISDDQSSTRVIMSNKEIKLENKARSLGVIFDSKLTLKKSIK